MCSEDLVHQNFAPCRAEQSMTSATAGDVLLSDSPLVHNVADGSSVPLSQVIAGRTIVVLFRHCL